MRVRTWGTGGCTTKGQPRVTIEDLVVVIVPADRHRTGDVGCERIRTSFHHEIPVRLVSEIPGDGLVVISGRVMSAPSRQLSVSFSVAVSSP